MGGFSKPIMIDEVREVHNHQHRHEAVAYLTLPLYSKLLKYIEDSTMSKPDWAGPFDSLAVAVIATRCLSRNWLYDPIAKPEVDKWVNGSSQGYRIRCKLAIETYGKLMEFTCDNKLHGREDLIPNSFFRPRAENLALSVLVGRYFEKLEKEGRYRPKHLSFDDAPTIGVPENSTHIDFMFTDWTHAGIAYEAAAEYARSIGLSDVHSVSPIYKDREVRGFKVQKPIHD